MSHLFSKTSPEESEQLINESLERLARQKQKDALWRIAALLVGILLWLGYIAFGKLYGLWGLGLLIGPFATWLILLGLLALVAAFFAENS